MLTALACAVWWPICASLMQNGSGSSFTWPQETITSQLHCRVSEHALTVGCHIIAEKWRVESLVRTVLTFRFYFCQKSYIMFSSCIQRCSNIVYSTINTVRDLEVLGHPDHGWQKTCKLCFMSQTFIRLHWFPNVKHNNIDIDYSEDVEKQYIKSCKPQYLLSFQLCFGLHQLLRKMCGSTSPASR